MKKNAIIFGSSGDLGLSFVNYLKKNNYNLVLTTNSKNSNYIRKKFLSNSNKIFIKKCNFESEKSIKNSIKFALKKIGEPDLIINTCGIFYYDKLENFSYEKALKTFKINALSTVILNKEIYKVRKRKLTKIISIGSSSALDGFKDSYSYCGSKHALLGIIKSLNKTISSKKIINFCINVGSLKNKMGKRVRSKDYKNFINQDEVIKAANYLIQSKAPGIPQEIYIKRF